MSAADIFKKAAAGMWTRYAVELQVTNQIVGGVPKDPDTIKGWLKARLEIGDPDLIELTAETHAAMVEDGTIPTADELADKVAREYAKGNGFKRHDGMLCYEGRCMKAALKEAANIAYPNKTPYPGRPDALKASGLASKFVERVFVVEDFISLGVTEPSIPMEQRIKHVRTAQGPRSAINVVDIVEKPLLSFHVDVMDDWLKPEVWARVWSTVEANGIGADRARGDGTCELVRWEPVS